MKRVALLFILACALVTRQSASWAQPVPRTAEDVLHTLTGKDVRGYYGSALVDAYPWTGQMPMLGVSQSGETDGPSRTGHVFFYDSLTAEQPRLVIDSPMDGEVFGWSMSGGGDMNGDGLPDLAVGAPNDPTPTTGMGRVYIYFGGPDFGKTVSGSVSSGEDGDGFGEAVNLRNDINGDGLADLIVGAPRSAKSGATSGRVYIWFGKREGSIGGKEDAQIPLGTTNDLFGTSLATGDLNGDGKADLVVGSPHHNVGEKIPGSVFIFRGGSTSKFTQAAQIISGEATQFHDQFGKSVAIVPDLNGDGIMDLIVGAPQVTVGGRQLGKAYLYHGGSPVAANPASTFLGAVEAGRFGDNVFSIGDVNGDGKGDFAVQARDDAQSRGVVYLYHGGTDYQFQKFAGEQVADQLGNSVCAMSGTAGNPSKSIAVGARWNDGGGENSGRVYVLRLE